MTRYQRPAEQARAIHLDSTVLATLIDDALHNLDLGLAGWPTSTPGASPSETQPLGECHHRECSNERPCPTHEPDATQELTATERQASTPDIARRDLEAMTEAIRKATHQVAVAATIANRWAHAGVDETSIKARLVAIDSEIWCANCVRYGRHEPRAKDRTECDFCSAFRQQRKRGAPKEIWDARDARGGKIDETTVIRILRQLDTERKATAAAARARQRAEGKAS